MWNGIKKGILGLIIGLIGLYQLPRITDAIETTDMLPATRNMLSIMPLLFSLLIVLGVFISIFGGIEVYVYYKWEAFGNRLKEAYSAKFGGRNPAFDKEVDEHVLVMRTMGGSSHTKSLAEDWLKRMARFVEVPFAVPEEEHLSEEEKTEQFASVTDNSGEDE